MIEPTDEMREAFVAFGVDEAEFLLADIRAGLAAVLAIVERDRCMEPRGHVHDGRSRACVPDKPLPLAVGRIQSYCGRAARPHAGHVWVTETGRWCPGDEVRP